MPGRRRKSKDTDIDIDEDLGEDDFTLIGDRGIYLSTDGERRREELLNTVHKKRRLDPSALNDNLAVWIPVPDTDFTEDSIPAILDGQQVLGKRKQYTSTVRVILKGRSMILI